MSICQACDVPAHSPEPRGAEWCRRWIRSSRELGDQAVVDDGAVLEHHQFALALRQRAARATGRCRRSAHAEQPGRETRQIAVVARPGTPRTLEGTRGQFLDVAVASQTKAEIVVDARSPHRGRGAPKPPVSGAEAAKASPPRRVALSWARRLKRVFGVQIEGCARCGGQLKIIASIEEAQLIAKILSHLERAAAQQSQSELPLGARGPPVQSSLL
jgi:hypothetical protein